jgi:hypothetical protein
VEEQQRGVRSMMSAPITADIEIPWYANPSIRLLIFTLFGQAHDFFVYPHDPLSEPKAGMIFIG